MLNFSDGQTRKVVRIVEKQHPVKKDSLRLALVELLDLEKDEISLAQGFLVGIKAQRHLKKKSEDEADIS